LIGALEERGFLERLPNKARALHVCKLPDGYTPHDWDNSDAAQKLKHRKHDDVIDFNNIKNRDNNIIDIPLCGKIAAGTPIEAISHDGNYLPIPASMIGRGDHYALVIEGDSMIEAGINDQDTVLIRKENTARSGDIVVALIDNQEATLKEMRMRGGHIDLIPKNRSHGIRTFEANRVQVQGVLAGLFRQY
jgi:repressor LexA